MAIDRWLLDQHSSGEHPQTLRFYTWSPPAISLGYNQHKYPPQWENLIWQGEKIELVRRPTGGRAVLHQGDLTYAVITSGLKGDRLQVYQQICEFLIQGWRSLGVELQYGTVGRGYIHNPNCFTTATGADLVLCNGAKLIGSAQMRRGEVILQHGSIRLEPNQELFAQVFGSESFTPIQLPQNLTIEKIITALTAAIVDCFNIQLVEQPLSEHEWNLIKNYSLT
ncbi:lipoate--protein ligase family protein [Aetokthonos hydrillicola Thurmond2011]|jgi:lipoate-protein ligase A|uniref:Lipoate--protein ligase family protein n=1 Tax=Aetokthonos hydrillicola Thurmond2011 TaxID=2712845 RepID=A0AAP5MC96_9CYAN|nr:biotin/lipoate A/B protein ligase family protein [Aetokthonos hydrillicola]MBO3460336.1 lipoate--protein ligase family protein [Aetokthonos hydrillicola CCALA 1050]MBW4590790.1 lipoate--protein ligase family protein [Aetokthonos hydrillicola CCALA 1050]MDR9898053.1 lipoate--protein ligase family protein [Aetokthonos hydrillicola Thurmond2011]